MSYIRTKAFVESQVMQFMQTNYPDWQIKLPLVHFKDNKGPRVEVSVADGVPVRANIGRRYVERVPGEALIELTVPTDPAMTTAEIDAVLNGLKYLFQDKSVKLISGGKIDFGMVRWLNEGDIGSRWYYSIMCPYLRDEPMRDGQDVIFA